jgi:hypothetical protein
MDPFHVNKNLLAGLLVGIKGQILELSGATKVLPKKHPSTRIK